ncbi:Citrate synthase [Plasmodiophora brassicae]
MLAGRRRLSSLARSALHEALVPLVDKRRADLLDLKKNYGKCEMGTVTVAQIIGGMRGVNGLLTETSLLDAEYGIKFRGLSIPEMNERLPNREGHHQPMTEAVLWLLMTGNVPSLDQCELVCDDLHARARNLPRHVVDAIDRYPKEMHPMTQLSSAVLAMQTTSKFAAAYAKGAPKTELWTYALDDSLDLIARLPEAAARIYCNLFKNGKVNPHDKSLDWSGNFARMLGFTDPIMDDLMRMYMNIHSDHEGGNVSAHTCHLVGSALADPYLSFSAALNGLAGPLHGLANQEVLRWIVELRGRLGEGEITKERLTDAVWETLNKGQVIPGYGHAVLRKTDPRYTCQREFALKWMPDDPMFKLVSDLYEVVPKVLTEHGKTANPWPNVDAHSGVLLQHYGLTQGSFYTVLFGLSRSIGVLASLVNDRIVGLPIERPKSWTSASIRAHCTKP